MNQDFAQLEQRANSPVFYIISAARVRGTKHVPISDNIKRSVLEVEYKEVVEKLNLGISQARYSGKKTYRLSVDEEVGEELIKHLKFVGFQVLSTSPKEGNIILNITW